MSEPTDRPWTEEPEVCRRENCTTPAIGRGLCTRHYARWHNELDEIDLPGDKSPAPEPVWWRPPRLD